MNKYRQHSAASLADWHRYRGCERKRAYPTRLAAHQCKPTDQTIYQCKFCKQWHRASLIDWKAVKKKLKKS